MKNDCYYHPLEPAKWYCGQCLIHYCSGCMPDADPRRQHGLCPHCGRQMRYLGAATEAEPFWQRLSAFFRYPFHMDPLLVVIFCTLVPLFFNRGLLGWVVYVVLALVLFKYTYAVIRHTAGGHMKPPPVAAAYSGAGFAIGLQQMVVFVAMVLLVGFAMAMLGPIPGLVLAALVVLALPASIMVLAMENSVFAALNPLNLVALISAIGWPYFVLYGFLVLMTMASGAAQDFAVTHLDPVLAQPLTGFLNSTYLLILFHMLGYLLFQYQEELGFASDYQDEEAPADPQRDRSRRIDADIDMNLKEGNYDRVAGILEESLKRDPANPNRLEQLYRLALARNDLEALSRHHGKLLCWMAAWRRHRDMQTLLTLLRQRDPQFQPQDPALTVACADLLFLQHQPRPALQLLKDFHKRFPDSDQIAPAYLLAARILANGFEQWDKAISFLKFAERQTDRADTRATIAACLEQAEKREPLKGPKASFAPVETSGGVTP
ncbi:MAG: tetratricopeptide repeat protein [Marinobacter sp.]